MCIEQLKDFIEIAESSSLSAAAKKLFVTPQALSASLGKMENEVGAKLLVRGQFGIELTKEGDIFLDTAQKIIRIYEAGLSEIHARPASDLAGALDIYVNLVSRSIVLPHLLRTFNQQFPHVKIRIYTQNRHQVYQTLQESPCQEIVSFFGRMKVDGQYLDTMDTLSGIEIYPVAQGKLTACVAASSPLAHY